MRLFHLCWLFILWLNMDESLQQTAITCTAPVIENGYVPGNKSVYGEHEVLRFACSPLYKRTEDRPSKCTKLGGKGKWIPTPACKSMMCKLDRVIPAGTMYEPVLRYLFLPGEILTIRCGDKYYISDPWKTSAQVRCTGHGQWTARPICEELICDRQHPHVARWSSWRRIKLGETTDYACEFGYKKTNATVQATCTREGWIPDPLCEEITCNRKDIVNADIIGNKQQYKYGEQARYRCKEGYRGNPVRLCIENGWIGPSRCTEITCNREDIENADIVGNKQQYKYRERARYRCKGGYRGTLDRICGENGWIGDFQCTETCSTVPVVAHASVSEDTQRAQYAMGDVIRYTCDVGYVSFPIIRYICSNNGWVALHQGKCTLISRNCRPPPEVANAVIVSSQQEEYLPGSHVTYRCQDNYTMEGGNTLQCIHGKWKKNFTCTRGCAAPPFLADGDVKYTIKSNYSHDETVEYQCQAYYTMEGEPFRTCISGEWTGYMRCIKPCVADEDDFRKHNITLKSRDKRYFKHDEMMEFRCARGRPVGAVAMRQRCSSGVIHLPTCQ